MTHVARQVDQIIDEGQGKRRSVIVQVNQGMVTNERLLRLHAEVHRRRSLSLTARDLLPAPQRELQILSEYRPTRRSPPQHIRETLSSAEASLATQVGSALPPVAGQAGRTRALKSLGPLLKNEIVQRALETTLAQQKSRVTVHREEGRVPILWTSHSLVLDIDKDDLKRLPGEVTDIGDIYPNRMLKLPHLIEVQNVPPSIQEEKASSWGINRIGALSVWGAYGARGRGVTIGLLDTGVAADHPDLKEKVNAWAEFDEYGMEILGSMPHDTDQHGTHCAGTIVGGRASGRWIGVAPEANLAAALVLPQGVGTYAQILAGIEWAIEQQVDVINMSLGGLTLDVEPPDPYTQAIIHALAAGILIVTSIGNEGSQTTGSPGNDWFSFSVGATDYRDRPAGFSGGRTHVISKSKYLSSEILPVVYSKPELTAPGVAITSSVPGGTWATFNGTSMATPHVAGAIALLLSATAMRETVPAAQKAFLIQDLLTGSVEELGECGQDHRYGFGRLDVLRAVGFAIDRGY